MYVNDLSWFGLVVVESPVFCFIYTKCKVTVFCDTSAAHNWKQKLHKWKFTRIHFQLKPIPAAEIKTRNVCSRFDSLWIEHAERHIKCWNNIFSERLVFARQSLSLPSTTICITPYACACYGFAYIFDVVGFLYSYFIDSRSASISPVDNSFKFNTLTHLPCHFLLVLCLSLPNVVKCRWSTEFNENHSFASTRWSPPPHFSISLGLFALSTLCMIMLIITESVSYAVRMCLLRTEETHSEHKLWQKNNLTTTRKDVVKWKEGISSNDGLKREQSSDQLFMYAKSMRPATCSKEEQRQR